MESDEQDEGDTKCRLNNPFKNSYLEIGAPEKMGGATTRRGTGRPRRKRAAGARPEVTTLVLQPGNARVHIVQVRRPASCESVEPDGTADGTTPLADFCHFARRLQHLSADYGMFVWPAAFLLADYLWAHPHTVRGHNVLEVKKCSP